MSPLAGRRGDLLVPSGGGGVKRRETVMVLCAVCGEPFPRAAGWATDTCVECQGRARQRLRADRKREAGKAEEEAKPR